MGILESKRTPSNRQKFLVHQIHTQAHLIMKMLHSILHYTSDTNDEFELYKMQEELKTFQQIFQNFNRKHRIPLCVFEQVNETRTVVRRVDDLGRVVIPKEIRKLLGLKEGTAMELRMYSDDTLLLRKYPDTFEFVAPIQDTIKSMTESGSNSQAIELLKQAVELMEGEEHES